VVYVPKMRTQLVSARSVAEEVAALANGSASDGALITEIGGPREERLAEVAKLLAARRRDSFRVEEVTDESDPDHELFENGGLLPGPGATLAGPTFDEWLDAQG
jgi:uncharacterized protein YbjT (DUF2867 family)